MLNHCVFHWSAVLVDVGYFLEIHVVLASFSPPPTRTDILLV